MWLLTLHGSGFNSLDPNTPSKAYSKVPNLRCRGLLEVCETRNCSCIDVVMVVVRSSRRSAIIFVGIKGSYFLDYTPRNNRNTPANTLVNFKREWLQVIHRNRFVSCTRELSRARRNPPTELLMGYMITNFNEITFEDGSVLEMCLDWFDAYTALKAIPDSYLLALLKGLHSLACTHHTYHTRFQWALQ
jgi:hypothetical protein